jgi:hypothetical protein
LRRPLSSSSAALFCIPIAGAARIESVRAGASVPVALREILLGIAGQSGFWGGVFTRLLAQNSGIFTGAPFTVYSAAVFLTQYIYRFAGLDCEHLPAPN